MKIIYLFLLFHVVSLSAKGQHSLTLVEAVEYATKNNSSLQANRLQSVLAKDDIAIHKSAYLPSIYADGKVQHNLVIPVTPVPAIAFDPNANTNDLLNLRFSTKWTTTAGLNADWNLFDPTRKHHIQEMKIQKEIVDVDIEKLQNDLIYQVQESYLSALIADEQYKLALSDSSTQSVTLTMCQQQYQEGRITKIQLNTIQNTFNSSLIKLLEADHIRKQSLRELSYYLGIPIQHATDLSLKDSIPSLYHAFSNQQMVLNSQVRPLLNQQDSLRILLSDAQIKSIRGTFLPTLSLKAYYGANYFDNEFAPFNADQWNGNSYLALNLHVPIFENHDKAKRISKLQIQRKQDLLLLEDQQQKKSLDLLDAAQTAILYEEKIRLSLISFQLANENDKLVNQQFREGRLFISDLAQSNYQYELEKNNYLTNAYNFIQIKLKEQALLR